MMVTRPACAAAAHASFKTSIRKRSMICAETSDAHWLIRVTSASPSVYIFVLKSPFLNWAFCCLTILLTRARVMPLRVVGSLVRWVRRILNLVCRLQLRGFFPVAEAWLVIVMINGRL